MEARAREKRLNQISWIVSILVFALVLMMRRIKIPTEIDFSFLPGIYSALNLLTALLLVLAYVQIRKKKIQQHKRLMISAIVTSATFLLLYVLYHFTTEEVRYCQQGTIRIVYFFVLITHIILAAVILPFILFTLTRALTQQYERHKKMARWVFPLWLYVALTGPICYIMLLPCH